MVFNSLGFLVFLASILLLDRLPFTWKLRKFNLLIASLLFYSAWYPPAVLLLVATLAIDYAVARKIENTDDPRTRKLLLALSLIGNFGVLGYFKYTGFLWNSLSAVMQLMHFDPVSWQPSKFLPLGISFYTFQSVSYVIDVYRRRTQAARSILDFALYVSFFPHLVAGPIVRFSDFNPQLQECRRATREQLSQGLLLVIFGLFLKVTIGDAVFAPVVEAIYGSYNAGSTSTPGWMGLWAGVLGFAGQLYCDFAGYSMCAVGIALCFGFYFPWNFRTPYGSTSFTEFWTRWHISLSSWIRDYIYVPLGGNRKGTVRTAFNVMTAFILSGFWHGASWNFGIWGALHGLILVIEKGIASSSLARLKKYVPAICRALLVVIIYSSTLIFFRAPNLSQATQILSDALSFHAQPEESFILFEWQIIMSYVVMAALFLFHFCFRKRNPVEFFNSLAVPFKVATVAMVLVTLLTTLPEKGHVFIYFQF